MIVMASHMQEQEVGDGTNFVLVFAGALLELAEELLRMGLSVSEVSKCSKHSCKLIKWLFFLFSFSCWKLPISLRSLVTVGYFEKQLNPFCLVRHLSIMWF